MGRPGRKGKDSPIDNKQRALAEQEEQLRLKMQKLQQIIQDAPMVAEQVEKRRKQDLVIKASQPTRRAESPGTLFDKRYDANVMPRRRTKSLRAEQQEARLKFFMLCALLFFFLLLLWLNWPK